MPKNITKIWIEVHDQSGNAEDRYKPSKQIRFKTSMFQSDLCDYSNVCIVVKGAITVGNQDDVNYDKKLAFKTNAPFISCYHYDYAEDLDVVMPMYNLLEYSKNYSKTSGSLWNCYRDEPNSDVERNINYSIKNSKSFDYKTGIIRKLEGKS